MAKIESLKLNCDEKKLFEIIDYLYERCGDMSEENPKYLSIPILLSVIIKITYPLLILEEREIFIEEIGNLLRSEYNELDEMLKSK